MGAICLASNSHQQEEGRPPVNWKDYEKEIHQQFQEMYPDADITPDAKVRGRYSNVDRQIDILIEDFAAGENIRIMVDAKFFSESIDVKEVESFIGMMQDVGADKGLLVTQKGYSQAAILRAHNDPSRVELDILNFDELKSFQGFGALPYSGKHGVVLPAPFGWVVDAERRDGVLATLYQRGLTFQEAAERNEWMYLNIFSKTEKISDLNSFIAVHETEILREFPKAKVKYSKTIKREKYKTLLRTIEIEEYPTIEYTGFIDFGDSIFFCVLFTPEELKEKNIKKLQHIISRALPFNVDVDSANRTRLSELDYCLSNSEDEVEKAEILIAQGNILMMLKEFSQAERKFNKSIEILPTSYGALKGKVELSLISRESGAKLDKAVDDFFALAPRNPTVCQDILNLYDEYGALSSIEPVMLRVAKIYSKDLEAKGNIFYHLGLYHQQVGQKTKAINNFEDARRYFSKSLSDDHMVFELLRKNIKNLDG